MSTITTINASDQITNSRAVINTNFANLNSDKIETSVLDTDTSLAANSDAKIPTQKAVKAYVDTGGNTNASTTARGIVEEATQAEVDAGTAAGGTGARLFINPSTAVATNAAKGLTYKKKIEVDTTEITHGNSTAEVTLFDVSIPGGTLGTNNAIKFSIYISEIDMEGSAEFDIRLKYGATTMATMNISGGATVTNIRGFMEGYLVADGATNAQKGAIQLVCNQATGSEASGQANVGFAKMMAASNGTATEDSTAAKTLTVSADWNAASVNNTVTVEFWTVELIA